MAGDRIPFDHDFPEKPEVVTLSQDTGVTIGEIMLRCHKLWRQFDRHTPDGFLPNLGPRGLAILCGGDEKFWIEFASMGWLIFRDGGCEMPGFDERLNSGKGCAYNRMRTPEQQKEKAAERKRRQRERDKMRDTPRDIKRDLCVTDPVTPPVTFAPHLPPTTNQEPPTTNQEPPTTNQESKKAPPPPQCAARGRNGDTRQKGGTDDGSGSGGIDFRWDDAKEIANQLVRAIGKPAPADGKDRRLIIQAAYLSLTKFDEQWLSDAIEDTRHKRPGDTWRYLRKCLDTSTAARGENLDRLLALTKVPQQFLTAKSAEVAHG